MYISVYNDIHSCYRRENEPSSYPGNDCTVMSGTEDRLGWALSSCDEQHKSRTIVCEYDMLVQNNGIVLSLRILITLSYSSSIICFWTLTALKPWMLFNSLLQRLLLDHDIIFYFRQH